LLKFFLRQLQQDTLDDITSLNTTKLSLVDSFLFSSIRWCFIVWL